MAKRKSGALLTRIVIDRDSRVPLFRQFEDQLRGAILAGSLSGATRLPAIRALAVDLGVSRTTVVQVLESLAAKGFLDLRRGSGTFVAPTFLLHVPQRVEPVTEPGQAFAAAPSVPGLGSRFGAAEVDFIPLENRPFLPNAPAYDQFPFALWPKNVNRQTRQAGATTWATAIRRAMRGESVIADEMTGKLVAAYRDAASPPSAAPVTVLPATFGLPFRVQVML